MIVIIIILVTNHGNNNNSNNNNKNNNDDNNPHNNENHSRHVNNRGQYFQKRRWLPINKKIAKQETNKVRSFSGVKVSCIYDNVKPTIREFNPKHTILHVGTDVKARYQGQTLTLHYP